MADGAIDINAKPTEDISVQEVFGIETPMVVLSLIHISSPRD